ncbi:MAG TPA: BON domain-containing protein [Candidatus Acidoferrales bacterium]|jgi:osmotically-inducible protein OsmY|nr:BON domain-containing protein [Candidatus Acidoferrales bacterium]
MKIITEPKEDLLAQLRFECGRAAANVQVETDDGAVTLYGTVPNYAEKVAAIKAVRRVGGVTAVADEIVVKLPDHQKCTDAEIENAACNAISWITTIPAESLLITPRNGRLTLEGSVETWSQRNAVEDVVRNLEGIVDLTNLITIKPQLLGPDVKTAIESSFQRHALLDAEKIDVEVTGTKVILRGTTSNFAEREEAEHAARSARGVTDVENQIVIVV